MAGVGGAADGARRTESNKIFDRHRHRVAVKMNLEVKRLGHVAYGHAEAHLVRPTYVSVCEGMRGHLTARDGT